MNRHYSVVRLTHKPKHKIDEFEKIPYLQRPEMYKHIH